MPPDFLEFAPGGSSFDTAIVDSDAWSHVATRLREAWQAVTPAEMREHYRRSMAEGISKLPETEGLPFGDEEFDPEASG